MTRQLAIALRTLAHRPGFALPVVLLAALGIGVGLALAALAGRFVEGHLFGVAATDPWSYASVAALLVAVALLACAAPAGRAVAVDPARALRGE